MTFYGLSEEQRLKKYAKEPEKHFLKPYINCLRTDDCRTCDKRRACNTIATRKKMKIPNPWEY